MTQQFVRVAKLFSSCSPDQVEDDLNKFLKILPQDGQVENLTQGFNGKYIIVTAIFKVPVKDADTTTGSAGSRKKVHA